jgi:alpha-amylase
MKNIKFSTTLTLALILGLSSCSKDEVLDNETSNPSPSEPHALNLENHKNGNGVMMQTFYWDVEPKGDWWNIINEKINGWSEAGIDRIWLPPASKGASGGYSMGYDPSDYFDFGNHFQQGTTETRFGSRTELENLIATAHDNNIEVIADIVLNHNSGGGKEYNPYREKDTYTLFNENNGNASGFFNRNYEDYHPNSYHDYDEGNLFYDEQDVCHHQEHVQKWLWKDQHSVAKYYKNIMKFDGWRFDYVKGFAPWVLKEWMSSVGGFAVGEFWDGYGPALEEFVNKSGINAFDFACFYKMDEAFDRHKDLTYLDRDMLRKSMPDKAVTFVANHDTEKDTNQDNNISYANKMKAYAYILTHDGYPTIFYSDYENASFQNELKQLILLHNTLATGNIEILYIDKDEYIMKRSGSNTNPGLILYINIANTKQRREISTSWSGKQIMEYTGKTSYSPTVHSDGTVSIEAPANSYSIYSIME